MAHAFRRKGDRFVARLDDDERAMVSGLMRQTRTLLSPDTELTGDAFADLVSSMGAIPASAQPRAAAEAGEASGRADDTEVDRDPAPGRDPALDRLLPDAHRGDGEVAAEFRRLTEEGLRQRKSGNLDIAIQRLTAAYGGRLELDHAQAAAFVTALTDVRLLLGERMGMRTEEDAQALHAALETLSEEDPLGYAMAWYDFLTWLQESLTHALLGGGLSYEE